MPGSDVDFKAAIEVLTKNLNLVPASAVPAIIDCVVASTGLSPSALFTALLDAFPKLSKDFLMGECTILGVGCSGYIISFIRSLIYLIKNFGIEPDALELFICRVFVPLLKQTNQNDSKLLNQIVEVLCEVVIETQAWDLMDATLVPNSLSSLGISLGKLHNGESSMYQRSQEATLLVSGSFPLSVACHILSSLLSAALGSYQADLSPVEMKVVNRRGSPENFAKQLVGDLSDMAVSMLFQTSDLRSYAIRAFLPSIFRAFDAFSSFEVSLFGRISVLSREYFSREVWNCCKYLLSLGPLERQDVYLILSLSLYSFFPVKGCKILSSSNGAEEFDIRAEKEFWQEIRRGLVDKEALVRKQALHVLKIALGSYSCSPSDDKSQSQTATNGASNNGPMILHDASSTPVNMTRRDKWAETEARSLGVGRICNSSYFCLGGQQRWQGFLLLYEMLEEYGAHLVEAAWVHQVSLLLGFYSPSDSSVDPIRSGIYHIQMESLEGIFSWLVVLWEQGFCHGNPLVRCLIMQSFLATDWENHGNCAKLVPESFVLGPFVQGLNDPVHHKNFGVKGVYSSETIEGAAKFFRHFSSCFSRREQVAFVYNLASVAKQESFGRAGLMALAVCLASAAGGTKVREVEFYQDNLLCKSSSDLIEALQLILERSKQHFNPNYRLQVCDQVLAAATSLASPCDMSPDVLLHFISTLPHEFTACDGSLRGKVLNWFYWSDGVYNGFNSSISRTQFLKEFCDFPEGFMKHNSCDTFVCYDDKDLDLWTSEAQRWARMLFLVIAEEEHFEPIYAFLHKYGKQICEKNQNLEVVPVKFLVLIFALVQEFQIQQETFHRNHGDVSIKTKVDQCILAGTLNVKRFTRHFIFILEGLWSFSRSVCSVFWSSNIIQDAVLPGSITGKLGGPSQRRLPSPTTTAVLRAISSLKAVASLSSWCALLNGDSCVDSAITFLWNISWKIIMSSSHNSETGAEIRLAAYEALVPVLKALSTAFSSLSFDLVMNYNNTIHVNVEDQPLLDLLGLTFLQNVNDLLAAGTLARSRRAVLMQWKWCCLDCLLSIPGKYIENGAQMGTTSPFFSHAALRSVFVDLVESLENAGESSILPMLRSVRMVLGLSFSGRMSSTVSSCDVIDTQMMWQLVQSVWVLHVNCNKRRVGPIAALLSSVLHSSLFNDLSMHEAAGNEKGPLKWFVEKILYEGVKSPRTILLAALHLTGLWLLYPRTIKYYMKELKLLTFYGSVAFDEDFEAELAENQDARKEFLLLSSSPDPELTEAFFSTEMYARVSVAVLFHKLADSANRSQALKKNEDALAALACGKMFLLELLDAVVNDKDLAKELYKKYSKIHRHKVRAWQMICVLSQFADENIVQQVTSSLHICLYRNNLPAVRQYLEIFAIQIYLKFPSLISEQFIPIFHDYNMRPQALSSYVFIAANVMLHSTEVHVQLKHLDDLLPPMIPFLTSHHHSLRGFTQVLVYQVLCKLIPAVDPNSSEVMPLEKKCFQALKSYLHTNSDCTRLRTSLEGILGAFDPNISATPAGLFSSKHEELEFECMPTPLMEQVINFLNDVREDLRYSMANDVIAIKNEGLRVEETSEETISSSKADEERLSSQIYKDVPLDFQKKVTLHQHERREFHANIRLNDAKIQMPLEDMEKEDRLLCSTVQSRNVAMERFRESRQQFILVASLLDRIPNLAGLARTCEVFKATGLTIADASVVHDRQFQLISVTAEKWVPIIEVPIGSIKTFLEKKKQEGFSILGLEQTANSTPLDKYSFPKKTVLVLGREKEGIPVDIIHVLDASLEIPQLGVVRSLNVHVSGAIALWEYTRQQRTKQP